MPSANVYACAISVIACALLIGNNELFKPWLAKKTRLPFPIELATVLCGTLLAYLIDLDGVDYNVTVVGFIPTG